MDRTFPDLSTILETLAGRGVRFIVIGGVAAIVHGAARATYDLDLVYARDRQNLERLAEALAPYAPYLRGVPPGLPFLWDVRTLQAGLNFTLTTTLGDLDLLGEVTGGGGYEALLPFAQELALASTSCLVIDLETLIRLKKAAGRPKDLDALAELEELLEQRGLRTHDEAP